MRHGKKFNHLSRTAPHRAAMLSNMASSLIMEKRITTTVAKAKALRKYVEPLITKAKSDTTQNRRVVFSYLQNKESIKELFNSVAQKVAERPGGYTRIIKTGYRQGDNAEVCMMELVDYNTLLLEEAESKSGKTRRSRRGGKKKSAESENSDAPAKTASKQSEAKTEDAEVTETAAAEQEETKAESKPTEEKAPENASSDQDDTDSKEGDSDEKKAE